MAKKQFKERQKRLTIPALFWDNTDWVPASKYPGFTVYTDVCLSELLNVSPMRVGMWRAKNVIPFEKRGAFCVFNLNSVIEALVKKGYKQAGRSDKGGIL